MIKDKRPLACTCSDKTKDSIKAVKSSQKPFFFCKLAMMCNSKLLYVSFLSSKFVVLDGGYYLLIWAFVSRDNLACWHDGCRGACRHDSHVFESLTTSSWRGDPYMAAASQYGSHFVTSSNLRRATTETSSFHPIQQFNQKWRNVSWKQRSSLLASGPANNNYSLNLVLPSDTRSEWIRADAFWSCFYYLWC